MDSCQRVDASAAGRTRMERGAYSFIMRLSSSVFAKLVSSTNLPNRDTGWACNKDTLFKLSQCRVLNGISRTPRDGITPSVAEHDERDGRHHQHRASQTPAQHVRAQMLLTIGEPT